MKKNPRTPKANDEKEPEFDDKKLGKSSGSRRNSKSEDGFSKVRRDSKIGESSSSKDEVNKPSKRNSRDIPVEIDDEKFPEQKHSDSESYFESKPVLRNRERKFYSEKRKYSHIDRSNEEDLPPAERSLKRSDLISENSKKQKNESYRKKDNREVNKNKNKLKRKNEDSDDEKDEVKEVGLEKHFSLKRSRDDRGRFYKEKPTSCDSVDQQQITKSDKKNEPSSKTGQAREVFALDENEKVSNKEEEKMESNENEERNKKETKKQPDNEEIVLISEKHDNETENTMNEQIQDAISGAGTDKASLSESDMLGTGVNKDFEKKSLVEHDRDYKRVEGRRTDEKYKRKSSERDSKDRGKRHGSREEYEKDRKSEKYRHERERSVRHRKTSRERSSSSRDSNREKRSGDHHHRKRIKFPKYKLLFEEEISQVHEIIESKADFNAAFKQLYILLFRVLIRRCSEDVFSNNKLDDRRRIEDFLDLKLNLPQHEIWKINGAVLKIKLSFPQLEKDFKSSINEFVLKDLDSLFDVTSLGDITENVTKFFGLFIDFIVNIFVVYRRTLILLRGFENPSEDSPECIQIIMHFFDELKHFFISEQKGLEIHFVKASICRPLFVFQTQNKVVLQLLKRLDFFKLISDNSRETEIDLQGDETSYQQDVQNFFDCLEKRNFLICEEIYEKILSENAPEVTEGNFLETEHRTTNSSAKHSKEIRFEEPEVANRSNEQESWDTAMRRHLFLMNTISSRKKNRPTSGDILSPAEMQIFKDNIRFVWNDNEEPLTWGERIAKKYYDRLFKEYCLIDLSRYAENKFGMRWRIERDLLIGKGQFVCGEVRCSVTNPLTSWEVLFTYQEMNEKRSTMVKVRLCPECSKKLNHYREHRKAKQIQKRKYNANKKFNLQLNSNEYLHQYTQQSSKNTDANSVSTSGQFDCPHKLQQIWDQPIKKETPNDSIEKELDDFLDSIID